MTTIATPAPTVPKVQGRVLVWTGLLVGLGGSMAANVASADPILGAQLSAAAAPLFTLIAAGLLERVPLSTARRWQRNLAWIGLSVVALAAFVNSFIHQFGLLRGYHNPWIAAVLMPIAVDGLIALSSVCMAVIAERRRELAAAPVAARKARRTPAKRTPRVTARVSDISEPAGDPLTVPLPRQRTRKPATTALRVARLAARQPDLSVTDMARKLRVSERTVSRHLNAHASVGA